MNKFIFQNNLKSLILLFSFFLFDIKFALTHQFTQVFDDQVRINQYTLNSKNKKVNHEYLLINCSDTERKFLISTISIELDYNENNGYQINQKKLEKSIEFAIYDDDYEVTFQVAEICIREVYVKTESKNINSLKKSFTFNSMPERYNKNMKAIPFITGYSVREGELRGGIFIESFEAKEGGFIFRFSSQQLIKLIHINYLYYEERILNNYYKLYQFPQIDYKIPNKPISVDSEAIEYLGFTISCQDANSKNCRVIFGLTGFDLATNDKQNNKLRVRIHNEIKQDEQFNLIYQTWGESQIYGITSQLVIFEMIKCNYNPKSQKKINYKDRCIEQCPDGETQEEDKERGIFICKNCCIKCPVNCTQCNQQNECTSCKEKFYLFNKQCQQTKPSDVDCEPENDYFFCAYCPKNCIDCNSQDCTSCKEGYYLIDKKCQEKVPLSTNCKLEKSFYNCNKCQDNCPIHCNDDQKCINCLDNKYYYKGRCRENEPEKTYKKDDEYFDCHQTCQSCKQGYENDCQSCDNIEFILEQNTCKCKDKKKGLNKTTYKCETCSNIGCSKCTNNNQQCEQCENKFDLINNRCQCKETFKFNGITCDCIDKIAMQYNKRTDKCECKDGMIFDTSIQRCKCSDNQLFFDVTTNSCLPNSFSSNCEKTDPFKPVCKKCEIGYKNKEGMCKLCDQSPCDCNLIGENFAFDIQIRDYICKDKYPYQIFEIQTKKRYCEKIIPNGFFCNTNNKCQECQQNCHTCQDQNKCSYCNEDFFLWQGMCFKICPKSQNLIENSKENICECPQGYTYRIIKNKNEDSKCLQPLKQVSINVENSFMSQRDDYMKNEKITITTFNNIVKITFNRDLLDEEKLNFDIFINIDSLNKDKDYFIKNTFFVDNLILAEIEVLKNQKCVSITCALNGKNQTASFKNTILTTSTYNKSQIGQKDIAQNIQNLSQAFNPRDGASKELLDFLKQFQFLCFLSNSVQVLGSLTLFKDSLPPLVNAGAEMGASFIFNQVPSSENVDQFQDTESSNSEILPQPYSIMQGLGLKTDLYSNLIMAKIIIDLSSLIIMIFLIARKLHPEKQYSLVIADFLANFIVSYFQSSITCIFFSIAYSLYFPETLGLAIFSIFIITLLFIEFFYLMSTRDETYIQNYLPNFIENINCSMVASKSYILVQFIKKFFVISSIIYLCLYPMSCTILIAVVFFCNGIYILRYRFFQNKVINIFKITQECFIGTLFCILAVIIKKYKEIFESSEILDEDIQLIDKYSLTIIIFFYICLTTSLLIFIIKLIVMIKQIFKKIQMICQKRQDHKQNLSSLEITTVNETQRYSKQLYSNFNFKSNIIRKQN